MDTVEDALEILANGREEEAADRLRDAFASPCEEEDPVLTGHPHAVACHLYADEEYDRDLDPEEVGNALGGVAGMDGPGPADVDEDGRDADGAGPSNAGAR